MGTIPAVYLGAQWYGAKGVMAGEAFGSLLFGVLAMMGAFVLVNRLERQHRPIPQGTPTITAVPGLETGREPPI